METRPREVLAYRFTVALAWADLEVRARNVKHRVDGGKDP